METDMTRKTIQPHVREDGVSFVDMEHFADGSPIEKFVCQRTECGYETKAVGFKDQPTYTPDMASADVTGGFYGPNGNGYNYWCPKCQYRMSPAMTAARKNKEALSGFFAKNI